MPYTVSYGPEDPNRYPAKPTLGKKNSKYVIMIILLLLMTTLTFHFRETIISWLVPGDDQVTMQSVESLLADLEEGTPVGEALITFCEEIVAHEG